MLDKRTDISTLANHCTKASLCFVRTQNGPAQISLCYLKISGILKVCPIFIPAALVAPEKAVPRPHRSCRAVRDKKDKFSRKLQSWALKAISNKIHAENHFDDWIPTMSRFAWEELHKNVCCCHFFYAMTTAILSWINDAGRRLHQQVCNLKLLKSSTVWCTSVSFQGFQSNFGYCINIKTEQCK